MWQIKQTERSMHYLFIDDSGELGTKRKIQLIFLDSGALHTKPEGARKTLMEGKGEAL